MYDSVVRAVRLWNSTLFFPWPGATCMQSLFSLLKRHSVDLRIPI